MSEKERLQYEKLVLTPIHKLIPSLAIPTVISMMVTMIYNLVDAYFVGKLGTSASAAIGIVLGVQSIIQAFGFMLGHGSGSLISVQLGRGDRETADRLLSTAFFTAAGFSIVLSLFCMSFLTPLMRLMGSTDTILPFSRNYASYILISGPALMCSCVLNNVMRYEGKALFAMVGLVSGGVLNMIGDPILMFGLGLGIDGAGLSTAISQYISFGILLYMFLSKKTITRISIHSYTRDIKDLFKILQVGFPSLIRQMLNSISTMTLNNCAMPYGDAAIAAMSIVGRVMMFLASAMIGIGQGFQPVSAFNYGAKKYARVRRAFFFTFRLGAVILGTLGILGMIAPAPVVHLFRDDPKVVEIGATALRFHCLAIFFQAFSVCANMMFQSVGRSREASFLASLRSGLFYIPILIILPRFMGLLGIQSAQMWSDFLTTAVSVPFVILFFREIPKEDMETMIDFAYRRAVGKES